MLPLGDIAKRDDHSRDPPAFLERSGTHGDRRLVVVLDDNHRHVFDGLACRQRLCSRQLFVVDLLPILIAQPIHLGVFRDGYSDLRLSEKLLSCRIDKDRFSLAIDEHDAVGHAGDHRFRAAHFASDRSKERLLDTPDCVGTDNDNNDADDHHQQRQALPQPGDLIELDVLLSVMLIGECSREVRRRAAHSRSLEHVSVRVRRFAFFHQLNLLIGDALDVSKLTSQRNNELRVLPRGRKLHRCDGLLIEIADSVVVLLQKLRLLREQKSSRRTDECDDVLIHLLDGVDERL